MSQFRMPVRNKFEIPKAQPEVKGLGDIVAKGIKKVVNASPLPSNLKQKILNCGGCGKRQKALNELFPIQP